MNERIVMRRKIKAFILLTVGFTFAFANFAYGAQSESVLTAARNMGRVAAQVQAVGDQQPRSRKRFVFNNAGSFQFQVRLLNASGTAVQIQGWSARNETRTSSTNWITSRTHTRQTAGTRWSATAQGRMNNGSNATTTVRTGTITMPTMR